MASRTPHELRSAFSAAQLLLYRGSRCQPLPTCLRSLSQHISSHNLSMLLYQSCTFSTSHLRTKKAVQTQRSSKAQINDLRRQVAQRTQRQEEALRQASPDEVQRDSSSRKSKFPPTEARASYNGSSRTVGSGRGAGATVDGNEKYWAFAKTTHNDAWASTKKMIRPSFIVAYLAICIASDWAFDWLGMFRLGQERGKKEI